MPYYNSNIQSLTKPVLLWSKNNDGGQPSVLDIWERFLIITFLIFSLLEPENVKVFIMSLFILYNKNGVSNIPLTKQVLLCSKIMSIFWRLFKFWLLLTTPLINVKHNKAASWLSLLRVRCLKENSHIAWCRELDTSLYSFFDKDEICPAMSSIPMGRLWCLCKLRPYLERKQSFALCQKATIHHGNSLKGVHLLWTGFVPSLWKWWCLETKSTLCHLKKKKKKLCGTGKCRDCPDLFWQINRALN